ncbi:YolD-like family protein [Mesobacillus foraminis]|uniref:YolD-like protein n=2 Tax=Mesobacillus foraminis TaxID=279826 RepID=A0A4R2BHW2_9BACI|nr:YolD-like family protein [Mesobacillus foraminis]MBT2759114.1 YolD-like family protein [Mesobacillus foraminis]TCN26153.1 YolD-like protein [Mesobacillus foraminis]
MFLKQLTEKKMISIDYYSNGTLQTIKGRVHRLNLLEQILQLKDEKQKTFVIQLSGIRQIY